MSSTATEKPAVDASAGEAKESGNKWYAWSTIHYGAEVDDNGHMIKRLSASVGDEVSAKKLSLSEDDWQELVDSRAVRRGPYPKVSRYESPKRSLISEAARKMEVAQSGGED